MFTCYSVETTYTSSDMAMFSLSSQFLCGHLPIHPCHIDMSYKQSDLKIITTILLCRLVLSGVTEGTFLEKTGMSNHFSVT